jgi:hypothetical protein
MRTLLRHCPEVGPLTLKAMAHRTSKPKRRLYGAYTPTEFAAIRAAALADLLLTGVHFADDGVTGFADGVGVKRPRPRLAGGAVVGVVTGCSAW